MTRGVPSLGIIILSHANPLQVLRLITTLNLMYDDPPIVWHHDFSQSTFRTEAVPRNVKLLLPSIRTGWGKWRGVQAFLNCLHALMSSSTCDWFTLLSGSDYPAAAAEQVLGDFSDKQCDAFIDVHQTRPQAAAATLHGEYNPSLEHLETALQYRTKEKFYCRAQLWSPIIRRDPKLRIGRSTSYLPFQGLNPYREGFGLFWGDHWFSGNRRAAQVLLAEEPSTARLQRHLRWRVFPEESYYQTVLCNNSSMQLYRNNKRFARWNGGGAHPQLLTEADVPDILSSGSHFARKFSANSPALDLLDAALLK